MKFSKNLVSKETEVEDFLITSIKDLQEEIDSDKDNISKIILLELYLCN